MCPSDRGVYLHRNKLPVASLQPSSFRGHFCGASSHFRNEREDPRWADGFAAELHRGGTAEAAGRPGRLRRAVFQTTTGEPP